MSMMPSALRSRFEDVRVRSKIRCEFGVVATTPVGQLVLPPSAHVIRCTLSMPIVVTGLVPANVKATRDVGTFCQVVKAAVMASVARCSVNGETPPTQLGLPLLQLFSAP